MIDGPSIFLEGVRTVLAAGAGLLVGWILGGKNESRNAARRFHESARTLLSIVETTMRDYLGVANFVERLSSEMSLRKRASEIERQHTEALSRTEDQLLDRIDLGKIASQECARHWEDVRTLLEQVRNRFAAMSGLARDKDPSQLDLDRAIEGLLSSIKALRAGMVRGVESMNPFCAKDTQEQALILVKGFRNGAS